jgi:type II secretory pathway component PulF
MNKVKHSCYIWSGINAQGNKVDGSLQARSMKAVKKTLETQHIFVLHIHKDASASVKNKLSRKQRMQFLESLLWLLTSGLTLTDALQSLTMQKRFSALAPLREHLLMGKSFAQSIAYLHLFPAFYDSAIQIGEHTGQLHDCLHQLMHYETQQLSLIAKCKKAVMYPMIVLTSAFIITLLLMVFVVPQFQTLYANAHARLPAITRAIIAISHTLILHYAAIAFSIILIGVLFRVFSFHPLRMLTSTRWFIRLDLLRWSHLMVTLLQANTPLAEALHLANLSIYNRALQQSFEQIIAAIQRGDTFIHALNKHVVFERTIMDLMIIAEKTGNIEQGIFRISQHYDAQLNRLVDVLSKSIEPVMMLMVSGIIGIVVIALYLPIFQIGTIL